MPLRIGTPAKTSLSTARETYIAGISVVAIATHLILRYSTHLPASIYLGPLFLALIVGGIPILLSLGKKLWRREFGSDLLAGISIVASVVMGEYLVGSIIVLMLSGGTALEQFATRKASSVLDALAKRMPQVAHRQRDHWCVKNGTKYCGAIARAAAGLSQGLSRSHYWHCSSRRIVCAYCESRDPTVASFFKQLGENSTAKYVLR